MKLVAFLTFATSSGIALCLAASLSSAAEIRGKGDKCIDIPNGDTRNGTKIHI